MSRTDFIHPEAVVTAFAPETAGCLAGSVQANELPSVEFIAPVEW